MKKLLTLASVSEGAIGLLLLAYPPIVVRLLLGSEIAGVGIVIARIAGISLIALGIACWPGRIPQRALCGMFVYSTLAMIYLGYVGLTGGQGILLWPAVAVHAVLSILLILSSQTPYLDK